MAHYDESAFAPPWNEWSNESVNAEKWDEFRGENVFEHPAGHERLPKEIARRVNAWKRPGELFDADRLSVMQPADDETDGHGLLTVNAPLMNVRVYRRILHYVVLYTSGFKNKWPHPWHLSDLVFSCCKADATWNRKSKPEYNPFGKYWLKLFFMGKFRMVCVSDHLPIDKDNNVLLPLCENNTVLWLPLLVKGLLRIYALTDEFEQFNAITCLTGWSCIRSDCRHVPKNDVWSSISYYLTNPLSKMETPTADEPQTFTKCLPVNTAKGVQCHRDRIVSNNEMTSLNSGIVISIVLSRTAFDKDGRNRPTSRTAVPIFVNSVMSVKNKLLPTWKRYRWTKWAVENNLIKRHEVSDYMNLVNFYAPCTAITQNPCSLVNVLDEYKTAKDEMQYELDFSYLEPFITCVEYYIKSAVIFPFTKSICFRNENSTVDGSAADQSKTSTTTDNKNCVYLHFESSYCESMLFTLSVCENYAIRDGRLVVSDKGSNAGDYPYVNVERFVWYQTELPTPLSSICTRGVSNDLVKFRPGLHVLKIWSELPSKYSLKVESTVEFVVDTTVQAVYEKLANLPKSITSLLMPIKQSFLQLYSAAPHTTDREQKLHEFYSSFIPPSFDREDGTQIIKKYTKRVQTAVVEWVEKRFQLDVRSKIDVYVELQELFQKKSLGHKQIHHLSEILKAQNERLIPLSAKKTKKGILTSKKSIMRSKSPVISRHTTAATTASKAHKQLVTKSIHEMNMFEILCNVLLHSGETNLNEYHLKNDLLNYVNNSIIYDEISKKQIDMLFLFRLELNTHSISKSAPTIVRFSDKNNDNRTARVMLVDNDTKLEIRPSNVDTNLFMVNRTVRGYTLLGWFADKQPDDRLHDYKLSFLGRTYQILHPCRMQTNEFYKYDTTVCENMGASEFVAKQETNRFFSPNPAHLLARVFLNVENAAMYTIYCYLETVEYIAMEVRVTDKENGSAVFASSSARRGKMALIPIVFLDPYYKKDTEHPAKTVFAIDVVLTNNVETDYYNVRDDSNDHDWTVSCIYDRKLTDVTLDTDATAKHFRYVSSIPRKQVVQKPALRRTPEKRSAIQSTRSHAAEKKIHDLQSNFNYRRPPAQSVTVKQSVAVSKGPSTTVVLGENEKGALNDISAKQNATGDGIKKYVDIKTENRQVVTDELYGHVLNLLSIRKLTIASKQSKTIVEMKKNSQFD